MKFSKFQSQIPTFYYQFQLFLTALMFYTRIPVPKWVGYSDEQVNKSSIYFPFIGWFVGGVAALVFVGSEFLFSHYVAIILSMIATILMTGAFHEDGFADVCDGFGGGWEKMKILEIMKDSRIGAYGMIGMALLLLLKYTALLTLFEYMAISSLNSFWIIFLIGHSLSRFTALTFVYTHEYAREDLSSKVKPIAKKLSATEIIVSSVFGFLPIFLFSPWAVGALVIAPLFALKLYLGHYFKKWIGGYTGDCLGATQQVSEVIIYLYFIGILKLLGNL
ncbi:cobalamin-5'-phosphate synthase [Bernardetia litoralis DSM 6794]|uniref:Adenosylcobinamide-GDP ribazoletransferase n=1 Tax=Bernardetia litoralis (strain ATCC 23117 / DSM 6794 / NBRC 15988 / NCIMB 1366 / Fx l1 / Sio-4) TaxID=880071 RepID=I4AMH7_BERLS|nr:adenosylcobinamide-GDP ribazoletransferase [Bernardetia litoralis]AFM05162.1 cobalamin-5'-phosphate synthase [Bernardetia litoralis DSM 6794]